MKKEFPAVTQRKAEVEYIKKLEAVVEAAVWAVLALESAATHIDSEKYPFCHSRALRNAKDLENAIDELPNASR